MVQFSDQNGIQEESKGHNNIRPSLSRIAPYIQEVHFEDEMDYK